MPTISSDYLTVLNLFTTDASDKQDRLIGEMRKIVDAAEYPGWISSTVHAGVDKRGTANFIQWRSGEDLEARYAGEEFRHRTLPVFTQLTDSIRLLQTEVAFSRSHPSLGPATRIVPDRDDYTVIEVFNVAEQDQDELIRALGTDQTWLLDTPGYRSHTVLRGLRGQGVVGSFVATYAQWADKDAFDAYRLFPYERQPENRQKTQARLDALTTRTDWNTYRVVHSRTTPPK
jgi:heme-degrading monooxygenase HmoA